MKALSKVHEEMAAKLREPIPAILSMGAAPATLAPGPVTEAKKDAFVVGTQPALRFPIQRWVSMPNFGNGEFEGDINTLDAVFVIPGVCVCACVCERERDRERNICACEMREMCTCEMCESEFSLSLTHSLRHTHTRTHTLSVCLSPSLSLL